MRSAGFSCNWRSCDECKLHQMRSVGYDLAAKVFARGGVHGGPWCGDMVEVVLTSSAVQVVVVAKTDIKLGEHLCIPLSCFQGKEDSGNEEEEEEE